ncbi:TonB-linked outer membrane protein, SusC/RagA family [Niabella drilacis]|uniref:TonB-linked outer membrane protein, SusC/RagA family n=2 Tax=Niabella drilacis (strain DSM 25811 / CCM 8410 / CCUG 62505 / LMG 26954 / E90) TaxID=1285928 RepID=A0A1G6MWJ4_NIADE|nr:TonB-linked outer membrane protein, SusC/RagA family [Niabella drilacis]
MFCAGGRHRELKRLLLIMKLTTFFLLCVLLQAAASGHSQNVTLSLKSAPIEKAFREIGRQTGYRFVYFKEQLENLPPVTLAVKNKPLTDVLQELFLRRPLSYTVTGNYISIKKTPVIQTALEPLPIEVRGVVTDSAGTPLAGATVALAGSSRAVKTNNQGAFLIEADPGSLLVITYIGFQEERIKAPEDGSLTVVLQRAPDPGMNEVVVLGFGQTQKRELQTGATASVSSKELKQSPAANLTNALAGRLPGLISLQRGGEPGNDAAMLFIRGRATTNGQDPLLTIDGVQKDYSAITLLDVNEIENITILKDASATALYGVKGANGVIIVTTKRGVNGTPRITMSMERATQKPVKVPRFLDSYDYALLANEAWHNDNPNGTPIYNEAALNHYKTGDDPLLYPSVDWLREIMKPGLQDRVNFNVSGGSDKVRYFVNAGYLNQKGVYKAVKNDLYDPNAAFKRYNFRSNIDINFDEDFSIGLSLFGAIEDKRNPNFTDADIFWTLLQVPPNYGPVKWPTGYYSKGNDVFNPLWLLNESGYTQAFNSSLSGLFSLERKLDFITKGLSFKGHYSFDGYFKNSLVRRASRQIATYVGGPLDSLTSYNYSQVDLPLQAPASTYSQNRDVWIDLSLNYHRTFGDHDVTGLLLANRTQHIVANQVPFVSQGMVARLAYNYKMKYLLEMNGAYNGTDNFAPDNRYGFFPSVSAGYVISKEPFWESVGPITFLKLRGSYGMVGNDQIAGRRWPFISEFAAAAGYPFGTTLSNAIAGTAEGAMANPDVSWEKSTKADIGIEMNLWGTLFSVKADYFNEKRTDILITRNTVPGIIGASGGQLPTVNWGRINNHGFEVELNHQNRIGAVSYFVNSNLSKVRNKVLFIDEAANLIPWQQATGRQLGMLWGLTSLGFFQNQEEIDNSPKQFGTVIPGDIKYKDMNGDGVIDGNDEGYVLGSNVPEVFYGISAGISWKNLDFSILFQGAGNVYRNLQGTGIWEFFQGGKVADIHQGRWTPETAATATYPALHYGTNANNFRGSTFFMDNSSYLRLKNVELGYTFRNVRLQNGTGFNTLRLYANAINLYTWTKARMFDPENYSGYGAVYPPTRAVNFGLSVSF